jgi:hypothetical protein
MLCITLGLKNGYAFPSLVLFILLLIGAKVLPDSSGPLLTINSLAVSYVVAGAIISSSFINAIDSVQTLIDKL